LPVCLIKHHFLNAYGYVLVEHSAVSVLVLNED
jgi:hypothetical protein